MDKSIEAFAHDNQSAHRLFKHWLRHRQHTDRMRAEKNKQKAAEHRHRQKQNPKKSARAQPNEKWKVDNEVVGVEWPLNDHFDASRAGRGSTFRHRKLVGNILGMLNYHFVLPRRTFPVGKLVAFLISFPTHGEVETNF